MPSPRVLAALMLVLALPGGPAAAAERTADGFSPERFFSGRTQGEGELKILFRSARPIHVQGRGYLTKDGTLVLRQKIAIEGEAPTVREWRLARAGGNRLAGTLTEARGPVTGTVEGDRLRLAYTMTNGLRVEQELVLDPGGATLRNRLTVRAFFIPVARVRETIRKLR